MAHNSRRSAGVHRLCGGSDDVLGSVALLVAAEDFPGRGGRRDRTAVSEMGGRIRKSARVLTQEEARPRMEPQPLFMQLASTIGLCRRGPLQLGATVQLHDLSGGHGEFANTL